MTPEIVKVVLPAVQWAEMIAGCRQILDRSVVTSLDERGITVGDLGSYLGALGEFRSSGTPPNNAICDPSLWHHLWFSVAVACDRKTRDEVRDTRLHCISSRDDLITPECLMVVSGTLDDWWRSIRSCLVTKSSKNCRILFGKVYLWLVQQGLSRMFPPKVELADGTLILEE